MLVQTPRIVFITIPGNSKRAFGNALHAASGKAVQLVVVQTQKERNLFSRIVRLTKDLSFFEIIRQLRYAFLLRISSKKRHTLNFFRATSHDSYSGKYIPDVIEVDSVNSDLVYEKLKAISPDLIVVWGSGMLQKRIIATAKKVINLHLGLCPFYRGAVANQYALLQGDFSKIGATIHYVNSHVDAGDIIKTVSFSKFGNLEDSFKKLNDQAYEAYLKVAVDIIQHKKINSTPQDTSVGKNFY